MENTEKNKYSQDISELKFKKQNAWEMLNEDDEKEMERLSKRYIEFLSSCKTERATINWLESEARKLGFRNLTSNKEVTKKFKAGSKVYYINKNRAIAFAVIGKRPLTEGMHIVAAHHDVPHLDLKAIPLYEKYGLALLKTHYYGGIKKFQWAAIPLALHCFAITKDNKQITFSIGEKPEDPVFTITDMPPHLSYKLQDERKSREVIKGEELNILVGNRPKIVRNETQELSKNQNHIQSQTQSQNSNDQQVQNQASLAKAGPEERVKAAVLEYLYRNYGITEEDLAWAEVSAVPAIAPREVGFNRELIGGFGHDDRSCVMAAFEAISQIKNPEHTAVVIFFDKEEIGSAGANSAQSMMIPDFITFLLEKTEPPATYENMRKTFINSYVLSADTNAPIDPSFDTAWDPLNSGYMGHGVWICKFTGSGGKVGSSEAEAEFIAKIRSLLQKNKIPYQFGEMGKVDEGGGGTVAKFLAQQNMHVLDISIPVLSLHSPFEVLSKVDYYYTVLACKAFLENAL